LLNITYPRITHKEQNSIEKNDETKKLEMHKDRINTIAKVFTKSELIVLVIETKLKKNTIYKINPNNP
jgi:hypothetical protein